MQNLFGRSRVLAVGDVHGMYEKLIKLMDKIHFLPEEDLLVFLGDYVDRGPDSVQCLEYVFTLQHSCPDSVICLMGNHEVMMSSFFLKKRGHFHNLVRDFAETWLDNGGFETLQQLNELEDKKREELIHWATDLPVKFRYQDFFFCHAGVQQGIPLAEQTEVDLLWKRQSWWEEYRGEETIVAGHTPVQMLKERTNQGKRLTRPQFLENHVILCDTGAFMKGGKLSCVDVLSGKVWQA